MSRRTVVIDAFHGARIVHGPERIRWTITHRDCWPWVGITPDMTPAQARARAASFWSNVDSALRHAGYGPHPDGDTDEWVDLVHERLHRREVTGSD